MASSTMIDVDSEYEIDKEDGGMDTLDFQDIPHSSGDSGKGKTHEFTNFPHSAVDSDDDAEEDTSKLLGEEKQSKGSSTSFWTFAYYQQFFDVETKQVGMRILGSMLPKPGSNYLVKEIRPNPDLYGPFWICTTLVFTTAIAGNLANYFGSAGKDYHWHYDFHKVTFAATAIFGYWWLIPLFLFGLMWWQGYRDRFSFLEMICVYGYSLAIYIPISVLWAIQVAWLQWTLVVLGAVISGSVLLMTFWPIVSEGNKKIAIGVMVFIFVMHAALAAGFVLYFFHVPVAASTSQPITTLKPNVTPAPKTPQSAKDINNIVNNKPKNLPQGDDINPVSGGNINKPSRDMNVDSNKNLQNPSNPVQQQANHAAGNNDGQNPEPSGSKTNQQNVDGLPGQQPQATQVGLQNEKAPPELPGQPHSPNPKVKKDLSQVAGSGMPDDKKSGNFPVKRRNAKRLSQSNS